MIPGCSSAWVRRRRVDRIDVRSASRCAIGARSPRAGPYPCRPRAARVAPEGPNAMKSSKSTRRGGIDPGSRRGRRGVVLDATKVGIGPFARARGARERPGGRRRTAATGPSLEPADRPPRQPVARGGRVARQGDQTADEPTLQDALKRVQRLQTEDRSVPRPGLSS